MAGGSRSMPSGGTRPSARRTIGPRARAQESCKRSEQREGETHGTDQPNTPSGLPPKQGLYDPANEHDACGVGFVVNIRGEKSHQIVRSGLEILVNLTHRGACGCDPLTGDGAGILTQIPHEFFAAKAARAGLRAAAAGRLRRGHGLSAPRPKPSAGSAKSGWKQIIAEEGQTLLGWRDVPVDNERARPHGPRRRAVIRQVFIARGPADSGRHARVEAVRHPQAAGDRDPRQRARRRSNIATCRACRRG